MTVARTADVIQCGCMKLYLMPAELRVPIVVFEIICKLLNY